MLGVHTLNQSTRERRFVPLFNYCGLPSLQVGVFMGAALTTGIAFGVAGWWMTNRVELMSFLKTATVSAAKITKTALTEAGLLDPTKRTIVKSVSEGDGETSDQIVPKETVQRMAAAARVVADLAIDNDTAGETGTGQTALPSLDQTLLKETLDKMQEMQTRLSELEGRLAKANL